MTSARKIKANRMNAQASKGPRSAQGKARAARNARRHGLSVRLRADPSISDEAANLAQKIAGENAPQELQEIALRIAEAQIDLIRIRRVRHNALSRNLADPNFESRKTGREKMKFFMRFAKGPALMAPAPDYVLDVINTKLQGPQKFASILVDLTNELVAMNRYEQRALSRRKFAIRDFDTLRKTNH